jgi:HD-GYP domain-containing protein (c-di-GMP phosphodiesterase class II)
METGIMESVNIDEIIDCLGKIAAILHDKPAQALKQLRYISARVDSQVPYRDGHNQRVSNYALKLGQELDLSDRDMVTLETAALLHDFGKICIDERILIKPSSLSDREKAEIQQHAIKGYYILAGFAEFEEALDGVRTHHEHYNGLGYPQGLIKENIPLIGRIIAIADAYDAMTSKRPYRKEKTKDQAIQELKACSNEQFDPLLVDAFVRCMEDKNN